MKRTIIAALSLAVLLSAPLGVLADEVKLPEGADTAAGEVEKSDEAVYYTIVKHDTLWDISKRFLKNPFKWPKIWKLNPYIKNPDLIYPGNTVKILPNGDLEIIRKGEAEAEAAKLKVVAIGPDEAEAGRTIVLEPEEEKPEEKPAEAPAPRRIPRVKSNDLAKKGFITEKQLSASGAIIGALEKKVLISKGDEVFISFKEREAVKPGDRFMIYTVGKPVIHPVRKVKIGNMVEVLGSLTIVGTGDVAEGRIDASYSEIPPGARVTEYREPVTQVEMTSPEAVVNGYIVSALESKENLSEGDIAYIDRGTSDGIKKGNIMRVYRVRESVPDPLTSGKKVELPPVELGALVVVDPGDNISTCIVVKSLRQISWGDQVSTARP